MAGGLADGVMLSKHLLYYNPRFCKVDSVNVQCPNSTQDNTILMMVLEAVM